MFKKSNAAKNHSRPCARGPIYPSKSSHPPVETIRRLALGGGRPDLGAQQRARPSARRSESSRPRRDERGIHVLLLEFERPGVWAFVRLIIWGCCAWQHSVFCLWRERERLKVVIDKRGRSSIPDSKSLRFHIGDFRFSGHSASKNFRS